MAFQPARRWLERLADRWVFGVRPSGYELVRRFGAALEDTSDLAQLAPRVAATVREGLGVRWARVAIQRTTAGGPSFEAVGAAGISLDEPAQPEAVAALIHSDQTIGRIECGPKVDGSWETADQDLLETLGRQAALAIRNAHLAAELSIRLEELAASRLRIIKAEDAERRRIERNIHDGVQQDLVALMAKLGLARTQLGGDPQTLDATLARLQDETRLALEELRELARGIHPPVLTDRGLLEAIEARAARLPLGVTIEMDRTLQGRRFAEEIEGAAYFLVCEALTNTVKHAAAQQASIRLAAHNGDLSIQVSDDGQGFDPRTAASAGLAGLIDRVEALGGTVEIVSRRGQGTTVSATLPAQEAPHA
jgi:signal transduction histidine kinase